MNKPKITDQVSECKIRASVLLKSLRSEDASVAQLAAKRFRCLNEFKHSSLENILLADIKHKHALAVIAIEKGFDSWADLQYQLPFIRGGFLNQWFAEYAEARQYLEQYQGYLLPYQKQFFVCTADYINVIGLDAQDPDWRSIGFDWVKPANKSAWQRLYRKWKNNLKNNRGTEK